MGRTKRKWHPHYFDHVVVRGNNRQVIFHEAADFAEFFRILHYVHSQNPFTLLAYCIMNNHYHLLIRSETPLSKSMMMINRRYSDYYKKRYNYTGHLYENRYYSDMVLSADGLLEVSRYIHQNPIRTMIPLVSALEHYPYSSYQFYKEPANCPSFLRPDLLINCFRLEENRTFRHYIAFCEQVENEFMK